MNNIVWTLAILMAFVAGYFVRGVAEQDPLQHTFPMQSHAAHSVAVDGASAKSDLSIRPATPQKVASSSSLIKSAAAGVIASSSSRQESSADQQSAAAVDTEQPATLKYPNEISDEEVDAALPVPFNSLLKGTHGILREKYKPFLESSKQDAWDAKMQNKITDFMLGNAYSKFIKLESLACRENFCEMRVVETKRGSTGLIMSEMFMQDWWDIGAAQFTMDDSTDVIAMYGLMMKK